MVKTLSFLHNGGSEESGYRLPPAIAINKMDRFAIKSAALPVDEILAIKIENAPAANDAARKTGIMPAKDEVISLPPTILTNVKIMIN